MTTSDPAQSAPQQQVVVGGDRDREAMRAYEHLWRRHMFADRLLLDRTSMLLVASSFLFLGFVALLPDVGRFWFQYVVPILGLLLCVLTFFYNHFTHRELNIITEKEREIIEREVDSKRSSTFFIPIRDILEDFSCSSLRRTLSQSPIFSLGIPMFVAALWAAGLVWLWLN